MVKDLVGGMIIGLGWFLDVKGSDPIADSNVRNPNNTLDFSVTQPFEIQLQCFGNVVIVYLFTYFIDSEKVIAFFAQIPLFTIDNATFYDMIVLTFRTR